MKKKQEIQRLYIHERDIQMNVHMNVHMSMGAHGSTSHRQHRAGRTRLDDLNNQVVSDVGDNRILQTETSGARISDFLVHLIQATQSPVGSSLATLDLILGRFFQ